MKIALGIILLVTLFFAPCTARAGCLKSRCFFVHHDISAGFAILYIHDAGGIFRGQATITDLATNVNKRLAFESNFANLIAQPPNTGSHQGTWYIDTATVSTCLPSPPTIGNLTSYYIAYN